MNAIKLYMSSNINKNKKNTKATTVSLSCNGLRHYYCNHKQQQD